MIKGELNIYLIYNKWFMNRKLYWLISDLKSQEPNYNQIEATLKVQVYLALFSLQLSLRCTAGDKLIIRHLTTVHAGNLILIPT